MATSQSRWRKTFTACAVAFLWTALFAIAYSQSPLYTSNQNQYFLHGLARAGYGNLSQDWLANTLDPTPVFSALVAQTYQVFNGLGITYLYYALLMGIYLFSVYGIADKVFQVRSTKLLSLMFLASIMIMHAAGLRFALSRLVGSNWAYILEDGVADQRMLGPVFQPSVFGVLLALSIYLFLDRKPLLAGLCAALAAIVHPTYLLASGLLVSSYTLVTYLEERQLKGAILIGLSAFLPVLPMLVYIWTSFGGQASEITTLARQVLVEYRIPHHALVAQWFDGTVLVKIGLMVLCLYTVRRHRIFLVLFLPFLAFCLLTTLQIVMKSYSLALLFPWRVSIFLVPISTTLLVALLLRRVLSLPRLQSPGWQKVLTITSVLAVAACVLIGGVRFFLDSQRKAQDPERNLEAFIYAQHSAGDTYLTPVKMQDFRLFTGAPVYIDFKSIPYKDSDVLEWYRRVRLADSFYKTMDCDILQSLAGDGVSHVVIPGLDSPLNCPSVEETYRDQDFTLYKLLPDQ